MNRPKNWDLLKWLLRWLGLPIIGGLLTYFFFLPRQTLIEQRSHLKREIVKAQYRELRLFKLFVEKGTEISTVNVPIHHIIGVLKDRATLVDSVGSTLKMLPDSTSISSGARIILVDSVGVSRPIFKILFNSTARAKWDDLRQKLVETKNMVDPAVYEAFGDILSFLRENPLPPVPKEKIAESTEWLAEDFLGETGWFSEKTTARWLTLNRILDEKINKIMSLTN